MKKKVNLLWLIGVVLILVGLLIGLKVNKVGGIVITVIGMISSIALILMEDKK